MSRVRTGLSISVLVAISLLGCRKRAPEDQRRRAEAFDVDLKHKPVFVYADLAGVLRQAPSIDSVPVSSRRVVRVIDPTFADADQTDYDQVYVVDLSVPPGGRLIAKPISRFEFERRALAALPAGQGSLVHLPAAEPRQGRPHHRVIVYSTEWCAACKQLRQHLRTRGVSFVEHDIERDANAAHEMAAKLAGAGVEASRVPVVDVRGRLLIGFDRQRIDTLLGDRT